MQRSVAAALALGAGVLLAWPATALADCTGNDCIPVPTTAADAIVAAVGFALVVALATLVAVGEARR
jgi:hypothetical protein